MLHSYGVNFSPSKFMPYEKNMPFKGEQDTVQQIISVGNFCLVRLLFAQVPDFTGQTEQDGNVCRNTVNACCIMRKK